MKLSTIAALGSFVAFAAAKPLEKAKRVLVTRTVLTEVVETKIEYHTVWVKPEQAQAVNHKDGYNHQHFHQHTTTTITTSSTTSPIPEQQPTSTPVLVQQPTSTSVVVEQPPPVVQQPTSTPAVVEQPPVVVQQPTSTPAVVEQPPVVVQQPTSTPAVVEQPPVVVQQPTSTPAVVVQPTTTAPIIVQQPTTTPAAPPSGGSGSSTADCGKVGSPCQGRFTLYDITKAPGVYNACGWQSDGLTEDIVAMAAGMMPGSNGDPMCNRQVAITHKGKTVNAKVVDKCPGCPGQGLDASHHLFDQFASEDVGVLQVDWTFLS